MAVLKRYTGSAWETVGASVSVSGYFPDMAPSSPHANDDEFNDGSLGGAWTEWDAGTLITVSEGNYGLKLVHASSSGNNRYGGVFRTIPVGDFTVITKVSHCFTTSAGPNAGVFVAADLAANPTTADFHAFVLGLSSNQTFIGAHLYADYQTFSSTLNSAQFGPTHCYMRIRRVSTLFSFDISTDGVAWLRFTTFTPAYTPGSIGLTINNSSAIANSSYFRFWRQSADTALDTPVLGRIL